MHKLIGSLTSLPAHLARSSRLPLCSDTPSGISIHALVKRATVSPLRDFINDAISIHALVKRATEYKWAVIWQFQYFNPRPREEGDRGVTCRACRKRWISIHALVKRATSYLPPNFQLAVISIHALVKRATLRSRRSSTAQRYFNPRPREEGDNSDRVKFDFQLRFQSTPS